MKNLDKMKVLFEQLFEEKILAEWIVESQESGNRQKGEKIMRAYKKMVRKRVEYEGN